MKLKKLIAIKAETERFIAKLNEAIARAELNNIGIGGVTIPLEERDCLKTKESAAFKRVAMDLKSELANLNLPQ